MLKTIFFGAPAISVPFLEQLHSLTEVILVVTRPDRPAGRGLNLTPCPVKKRALELGLKVISPEIFKNEVGYISSLKADLGLAVAYGKIFKKPALDAFKLGIINIHFSLLPQYRGAAPVQYALFEGRTQSGVTAFWIDEGLDSGPIAAQNKVEISPQDNEITLFEKLTIAAEETLQKVIDDIINGKIIKTPQSGVATFAPLIEKQDTVLSFKTMTAGQIHNIVRGLAGGVPAYAKAKTPDGITVQILKTSLKPFNTAARRYQAGTIIAVERGLGFFVECYKEVLFIENIRPAGKTAMSAWDYANGKKLSAGKIIFT
ncbi:MAG: methionyl-tRNA formyltransferase [Elusimicrobiota bacterium]|jgi:methionyl-tRNA formyltransferase|nr:methionyl-tRNA formyltransferase [Elusimicrobiota bacterium]